MKSLITNLYEETIGKAKKLNPDRVFLYNPEPGKEWMYSHHPFITFFKGNYIAIWSNGLANEDDVAQRVFWAKSKDGKSWTKPSPFVDSEDGLYNQKVLYAEGFHIHNETLVAYITEYEYQPESVTNGVRDPKDAKHMNTKLWAITTNDGENWSDRIDLGLKVGPNHAPQKTASGRLIMSVSFSYPYTDDPSGLTGWKMSGVYPEGMEDDVVDDSEGIWKMKEMMGWDSVICEGSFFQTDDQIIHMMLRTNTGFLKLTESQDDGETWSEPMWTEFTDNSSKFHFGRLPDGRFYYVGNADPTPQWSRARLILSLSDDGVVFDQHYIVADSVYDIKQKGMHKGGNYGYPHTLVHDGKLNIICSRRKEAIEFFQIDLKKLDK